MGRRQSTYSNYSDNPFENIKGLGQQEKEKRGVMILKNKVPSSKQFDQIKSRLIQQNLMTESPVKKKTDSTSSSKKVGILGEGPSNGKVKTGRARSVDSSLKILPVDQIFGQRQRS